MQILVSKNSSVKIMVYCWEKDGEIDASHLESDAPEGLNIEKVEFSFRRPTYADSTTIMKNSNFQIGGEDTKLDAAAFQEQILLNLLADWDLKDEEGNEVTLSPKSVASLTPSVARAAVAGVLDHIKF